MTHDRYRRQKLLHWLDDAGQRRIGRSTVLIARVGGLGGPLTQSLAVAGVGRIVFYHEGELLEEDLHRMILMDPGAVGKARAPQAAAALRRFGGSGFDVVGFDARITPEDATRWMEEADIAVGAAPTFEERLCLNDAAVAAGKPFVDAAMYGDETQLLCVKPGETACLRCMIPEVPPWRDDFPVLAAVSATIGSLAASCVVRILAGNGNVPWGSLIHFDAERVQFTRARVPQRPDCPACARAPE